MQVKQAVAADATDEVGKDEESIFINYRVRPYLPYERIGTSKAG